MAIDPSIYAMSGRGVTPIEGPLDIAMKAAQVRQMGTQAQMGQLKLQEGQQNFQDTQAMRDLAKQSGGDPNAFMEGLLKLGTPAAIGEHAKLQTERLQQSKIDKEMRLAASQMTDEQLKQRKSLVDDLARAADWVEQGGVQAPQRWQQAMSHYPPQVQQMIGDYSPDKLALARAQAKSMEQVFKERQDKQKQEFEDRKQTETERHNVAMEKKPNMAMVIGGAGGLAGAGGAQGGGVQPTLEAIPAGVRDLVKAIGEYRMDQSALNRNNKAQVMQYVAQVYPNYSAADAKANAEFVKGLASTKPNSPGGVVGASERMIEHASDVLEASKGLGSSSGTLGHLGNVLSGPLDKFSNPAVKAFELGKGKLMSELNKLVSGGVPHAAEMAHDLDQLSFTDTPEQKAQILKAVVDFGLAQANAVRNQRDNIMGQNSPGDSMLTPKAHARINMIYQNAHAKPPELPAPGGPGYTRTAQGNNPRPAAPSGGIPKDVQARVDALKAKGVPQADIDAALKKMGY